MMSMINLDNLPNDLLVSILSHLDPKEIGRASWVCRNIHGASNEESLWKTLAIARYGTHVTHSTRSLYSGGYKEMVVDDNRLGALPTLDGLWKSDWRNNNSRSFYCCLLLSIKWHRPTNMLWFYLDARGESDLRRPQTSGIWLRDLTKGRIVTLENRVRRNAYGPFFFSTNVHEYQFVPEPNAPHRNDRYKGILKVKANLFHQVGKYEFCYANPTPSNHRDYQECTLFTVEVGQTLMDVFAYYSLETSSPFSDDIEATWNERWKPHLLTAANSEPDVAHFRHASE